MSEPKKVYLGDGVYASNDGWQIVLEVEGRGAIYLELGVFNELLKYAEKFWDVKITAEKIK